MRKALVVLLGVCLLALYVGSVSARDIDRSGIRAMKAVSEENPALIDEGLQTLMASAAADTYCIVWYDFEQMVWQGWTQVDNTAQVDTFFHVDDFAGLGGGDFGRLVALEGTKSLWCGTPPGTDFYLCSWVNAPGYGNGWNQICYSDPIPFTGILTWSFKIMHDSEPDWDMTYIEYDAGDDNWVEVAAYDGVDTLIVAEQLLLSQAATKLRYHFIADGAWSDQDGLYDTDGGCVVDSITITDAGGVIDFENFESYGVGAKADLGIWHCRPADAYGAFSGLANNLTDKDPCSDNFGTQIMFFNGSPYPSADYPGLFDTPFCTGPGGISAPCQDEQVISPVIDMTMYSANCDENIDTPIPAADLGTLGGAILRFTTYRDIPLANLVFYTWGVRSIIDGCPGQWLDRNFVYYGGDKDYIFGGFDVSDLVGPRPVQVTVGVSDMCDGWYLQYGNCAAHTPSPWLDNVRMYRYKTIGPSWSVRMLDMFQDTFPVEKEASANPMEEYCRADAANDIAPGDEFDRIDPGDSAVVQVSAPLYASTAHTTGLDTLVTGENRVYFHCNTVFLGTDGKPDLFGPSLQGTYGTYVSDDGDWTTFLCPPAETSAGNAAPDKYCIDLNDSLFTRGYMIEYYFSAWDLNGDVSYWPSRDGAPRPYEFTCLPTLRVVPGALYCDDFHARGTFEGQVDQYFTPAFEAIIPSAIDFPDKYETNGPSSGVSNGIGAYVSADNASSIFCTAYEKVIHDSGDLNSVTITEGTDNSDKSNDAQLLVDWMNISEHKVGLLVMGDQVAYDLSFSAAAVSLELVSTLCGVTLENGSYYDMTGGREAGGVVTPLITGVTGGPYDGLSYYAFGGCPIINDFDVLEATGPGQYALKYPDYNSLEYYAGIYTDQLNNASQPLRTVWVGHSFMLIRDAVPGATAARNQFLAMTYEFFENGVASDITDAELPKAYSLAQNFPNPFNPSTRIQFALPAKGHVSLKIYDVAGRLVKTLQDGVMDAGSHELTWDGSNNLGKNVASGVYFYKINAGDNYENMKKMVLLR
jgi:hypothetical protein